MKNSLKVTVSTLAVFFLLSCSGNKNDSSKDLMPDSDKIKDGKKESNALTQSLPTIMVFPSDGMLERIGYLKSIENEGTTSYQRNYQQAFIKDPDLKFVITSIEGEFSKAGFPMENMEQQLKQIDNTNAMDEMTDVDRDARAELLNTARPDYIIELDYDLINDPKSRNLNKSLNYTLKCLDVYTNKTIATSSRLNVGADKSENDIPTLIKSDLPESLKELKGQITDHYANLLANGLEVTLRVVVSKASDVKLDDDCGGEELNEKINNWLKDNTVNQTFKMSKNTSTEMFFTNVRIAHQNEEGKKYTAYDFAQQLTKAMKNGCSIKVKNKTQSLGDAYLIIEGSKL